MTSTSRVAGLALSAVLTGAATLAPVASWAQAPIQGQVRLVQATSAGWTYRDGVYTGPSVDAYYGNVQIQVRIQGGRLVALRVLDYPADRRTSRYINSKALPWLTEEVIRAQSARVNAISGATLTSEAFIRSTYDALRRAGG